jgi:hypothetical protein
VGNYSSNRKAGGTAAMTDTMWMDMYLAGELSIPPILSIEPPTHPSPRLLQTIQKTCFPNL